MALPILPTPRSNTVVIDGHHSGKLRQTHPPKSVCGRFGGAQLDHAINSSGPAQSRRQRAAHVHASWPTIGRRRSACPPNDVAYRHAHRL